MHHSTLLDEDFPARVEVVFPDRAAAASAAKTLCQRFGLDGSQISILDPGNAPPTTHRNRFAHRASGITLQRRQLAYTFAAFALLFCGLLLLPWFNAEGALSSGVVHALLALLVLAAVGLTAVGLLSWRPARPGTRSRCDVGEAVLLVEVHDISEQYQLREALLGLGAKGESADISGPS